MDKIYFLEIFNRSCNFRININDISLYKGKNNSQISAFFPINEYLIKNKNIGSVDVLPLKDTTNIDTNAAVDIKLWVAPKEKLDEKILISEYKTTEFLQDEAHQPKQNFSEMFPLAIDSPPISELLNSLEQVTDIERVNSSLITKMRDIYNLFEAKNIDNIISVLIEREKDLAIVNYGNSKERLDNLRNKLNLLFNDDNEELLSFEPESFFLKTEFYGKLFSLEDKHSNPAIMFYNEEFDMCNNFAFKLGFLKGKGELIVIR